MPEPHGSAAPKFSRSISAQDSADWQGGSTRTRPTHMRIKMTSLMVDDQSKALRFYTEVLGFSKKHDIPVGEYRWITVAGDEREDLELALEPNANPAGKKFQDAMFAQGIPLAAYEVGDSHSEFARLTNQGFAFTREPTNAGPVTIAVFADTCGNPIQLYQRN